METLEFILKKYNVNPDFDNNPVPLGYSRWKEYPKLLKELGMNKGVEIGVYKGQFSETLCQANPDLDLTGVDAWTVYKDYKDYGVVDLETTAYDQAKIRADRSHFKLMKAWSVDASKEFADGSLDFVFIDGNHDFQHVVEDVVAWSPKVRKGGIVSGHDFFRNHHKRFGVREAIPAWCDANQIKPLFAWIGDKCPSWMYVK